MESFKFNEKEIAVLSKDFDFSNEMETFMRLDQIKMDKPITITIDVDYIYRNMPCDKEAKRVTFINYCQGTTKPCIKYIRSKSEPFFEDLDNSSNTIKSWGYNTKTFPFSFKSK